MAKTEITKQLEMTITQAMVKVGTYGCLEVTIGTLGEERVDYMTVDSKGTWRCFEVKCSVSDFRSKAKKSFVGHYNYFVLTEELYEKVKDEIASEIGVYVGLKRVRCVKRAKKQELKVDENILTLSMIRSLSRDANKLYVSGNDVAMNKFNREINRLTEENRLLRSDLYYARLEKRFGEKSNYKGE